MNHLYISKFMVNIVENQVINMAL